MRELLLFVIGAAAGMISGMGMGGGTLLIPALTLLMGIPQPPRCIYTKKREGWSLKAACP